MLPVAPMLARLERELPRDGYLYEPKWDGFRCLAFRDGDDIDLRSRNQRPLARAGAPLALAELTADEGRAATWLDARNGIDGVVAKHRELRYEPGVRAMVKVRRARTAECVGRWTPELGQDWVPLAPELVCEVTYDLVDHNRFRHPARFRRWRPDRDPRGCTLAQLA